ncbi:MAG: hypothetical protein JKY42_10845 [Flavobacteriales bacterium]|nr:hypothetical protein [Flavobacteriales bacterium]
MGTLNKIMEMFWLALGTVLVFISGYMIYVSGFEEAYMYLLITAMPFGMFFARRIMRKKMENMDK